MVLKLCNIHQALHAALLFSIGPYMNVG